MAEPWPSGMEEADRRSFISPLWALAKASKALPAVEVGAQCARLQGGEVWPCTETALRGSSRCFEASNCGQNLGSFWSRERSALPSPGAELF